MGFAGNELNAKFKKMLFINNVFFFSLHAEARTGRLISPLVGFVLRRINPFWVI